MLLKHKAGPVTPLFKSQYFLISFHVKSSLYSVPHILGSYDISVLISCTISIRVHMYRRGTTEKTSIDNLYLVTLVFSVVPWTCQTHPYGPIMASGCAAPLINYSDIHLAPSLTCFRFLLNLHALWEVSLWSLSTRHNPTSSVFPHPLPFFPHSILRLPDTLKKEIFVSLLLLFTAVFPVHGAQYVSAEWTVEPIFLVSSYISKPCFRQTNRTSMCFT